MTRTFCLLKVPSTSRERGGGTPEINQVYSPACLHEPRPDSRHTQTKKNKKKLPPPLLFPPPSVWAEPQQLKTLKHQPLDVWGGQLEIINLLLWHLDRLRRVAT